MKKRRIRSRLWLDECGAGAAFFVGTTCRKEAASRGIYPSIRKPELLSLPNACNKSCLFMSVCSVCDQLGTSRRLHGYLYLSGPYCLTVEAARNAFHTVQHTRSRSSVQLTTW